MNPLLSIVIPTREEAAFIGPTIEQFHRLTIPHEIIVADAQSADRTAEIAASAGARVAIDTSGIRRAAQQRNRGAQEARGDFLVFIDATVRLPDPDQFFARALSYFENAAFVGLGGAQRIEPAVETPTDRIMLALTNATLQWQNNVLGRGICSGKFQMVRRTAFERVRGYNASLVTGEDHELFERLSKMGKTYLDRRLVYYYAGRREHAWGWWKLVRYWVRDEAALRTTGKSLSEDWAPITK